MKEQPTYTFKNIHIGSFCITHFTQQLIEKKKNKDNHVTLPKTARKLNRTRGHGTNIYNMCVHNTLNLTEDHPRSFRTTRGIVFNIPDMLWMDENLSLLITFWMSCDIHLIMDNSSFKITVQIFRFIHRWLIWLGFLTGKQNTEHTISFQFKCKRIDWSKNYIYTAVKTVT